MAIKELQALVADTYPVAKTASFYAGQILGRDSSGGSVGLVRPADRASDTVVNYVGLSADDKARTGCTFIQNDPVGSTYIDGSGNFVANNNGWFVAMKRAISDYYDETVTNISNLTSGAGGYDGPRRGVGVFISPSGKFITDQFALVSTSSSTADSGSAYAFSVNDQLTFGAGANAGKFVHLANTSHGPAIAKVDSYDATAGLLYITQLQ